MKTTFQEHVFAAQLKPSAELTKARLFPDSARKMLQCHPSSEDEGTKSLQQYNAKNSVLNRVNKLGRKADSFANGIREHVKLGPKITETVKGKLSLGARILKVGGLRKIYKKLFNVMEGEKLLKASQCYLYTTSGPLAGLLFISTDKISFCSDRSIKVSSPTGEYIRIHYKVVIPLEKVFRVNQSENVKKPSQKYIEIVTLDNFDFWFMDFLNYEKTFQCLKKAERII